MDREKDSCRLLWICGWMARWKECGYVVAIGVTKSSSEHNEDETNYSVWSPDVVQRSIKICHVTPKVYRARYRSLLFDSIMDKGYSAYFTNVYLLSASAMVYFYGEHGMRIFEGISDCQATVISKIKKAVIWKTQGWKKAVFLDQVFLVVAHLHCCYSLLAVGKFWTAIFGLIPVISKCIQDFLEGR
ncbi:hypothetical protein MA16_Dca003008 [Dendrobium catenatum]|uniref:Uncharacterized protein n=1 Tax=Dendrobium catenatum TaxID=906689 RepID=A0A2I0X9A7_9ASPA|nr:hypothetical protein MA16_Dca003008 [Dendrobium catenatum]